MDGYLAFLPQLGLQIVDDGIGPGSHPKLVDLQLSHLYSVGLVQVSGEEEERISPKVGNWMMEYGSSSDHQQSERISHFGWHFLVVYKERIQEF